MYLVKGLAGVYRFTKSYRETVESPFVPVMLMTFIMNLDESGSQVAVESRVQAAGGWQPFDGNFAQGILNALGPELTDDE